MEEQIAKAIAQERDVDWTECVQAAREFLAAHAAMMAVQNDSETYAS